MIMKKILFSIFLFFIVMASQAQNEKYTLLLTGASFASPQNTWFEMGCGALNANPLNRAIGGEAITNTANRMVDGTLYSAKELEEIDAFVIMQVHNRDVFESSQIKEKYTDYQVPFDRSNYAATYDYVIKRYISECYNLKFNKESKYYNTPTGKPAIVVLCTDWHDGRVTYNTSIRLLAQKWGFPLVEFDKSIGFSKNQLHPDTGEQYSLIYAQDNQNIDGVKFGWHPQRGKDKYIQQRMAAIFADTMRKILPLR